MLTHLQPKKPFIKKKEAVTFHLVHQSVKDEGTDNPYVRRALNMRAYFSSHKMFLHEVAPANVKVRLRR